MLRLLRVLLLVGAAAAAAAAAAVCCHGFLKVGLPEAANDNNEIKWVSDRELASGPVEQVFESTWSRVFAFFSFAYFLPIQKKTRVFFGCSDLVICGFFVWSDSARTATPVVIL